MYPTVLTGAYKIERSFLDLLRDLLGASQIVEYKYIWRELYHGLFATSRGQLDDRVQSSSVDNVRYRWPNQIA